MILKRPLVSSEVVKGTGGKVMCEMGQDINRDSDRQETKGKMPNNKPQVDEILTDEAIKP